MSTNKRKILIIDDEVSVSRFIRLGLTNHNYDVVEVQNGKDGIQKLVEERFDLVVLDFNLPDSTGIDILKNLREWSQIPVIFLTVRGTDEDKVSALDCGADDYLTKPFSMAELLARIRVALRHSHTLSENPVFRSGPLEVDRQAHLVRLNGSELKLTATEFALLSLLATHAGKVVPHRLILKEIWGPNSVEHNHYLRVYFGQIRKKMDAVLESSGKLIENESGIGYRLRV